MIDPSVLAGAQDAFELYLMPSTCRIVSPGTASASMGQTSQTGADTVDDTVPCRVHALGGTERLAAQGASVDADYMVALPVRAELSEQNEIVCVDTSQRFRVLVIERGSFQFQRPVLCKEIKQA